MYLFAIPPFEFGGGWFYLIGQIFFQWAFADIALWVYARISHRGIPLRYYIILGILGYLCWGVINDIIFVILMILIIYYVVVHRLANFNRVAALAIYAYTTTTILSGISRRIFMAAVQPFNLSALTISTGIAYCLPFMMLLFQYLLLKLTTNLLRSYTKVAVPQMPVTTWIVSILFFSIDSLKIIYNLRVIVFTDLQFTFILFLYLIGFYLVAIHLTKYAQAVSVAASEEIELDNLRRYTSHIEAMYDELRRFRHDYKNVLLSLSDAIQSGNMDNVKAVFHQVVIPTNDNVDQRSMVLSHLSNIQDLALKSIIYSKVISAINQGITVSIEVENPIKLVDSVAMIDMVRMLSILLDNAIQAALNSEEKKINISFFEQDHQQLIVIGNTTEEERVNLANMHNRSPRFNRKHGIGLRNLRLLLARYPQISNNRRTEKYWFEQVLIIHH